MKLGERIEAKSLLLLYALLLYFLIKNLLVFIFQIIGDLNSSFPLDYGEGPVLNSANNLVNGIAIYPTDFLSPPWNVTNYPPVFYALLVLPIKAFGVSFVYGRIISTVSIILSAILIGCIVFRFFQDRIASFLAAISFLCMPIVIAYGTVGRVDSLALFFSLAGMYLTLCSDRTVIYTVCGWIFFIGAVFTKPTTLVWGPMVSILFLSRTNLRTALTFFISFYSSITFLAFLLNYLTHGGFFLHTIFANANQMDFSRSITTICNLLTSLPVLIISAISIVFIKTDKSDFRKYYFVLLVLSLLSLILIGKKGSGFYYLFDLGAVLSIACGAIFHQRKLLSNNSKALLFIMLIVQFWYLLEITGNRTKVVAHRQVPSYLPDIMNIVSKAKDVIIMDDLLGMELLVGKQIFYQPFEMLQLQYSGYWNEENLIKYFENGYISTLILRNDRPDLVLDRWSPRMIETINKFYKEERVIGKFSIKKHI